MNNRGYSLFELKSFDDDARTLTGLATTPTPDRLGDIVEPAGARFKLPIPLLWQHNSAEPIGSVTGARVGKDGIEVSAKLAKSDTPGKLKDRLDEAWESLKIGLVRGLSIGFRVLESKPIESGLSISAWEWLELSAVTIPANTEASIQQVKFFDQKPDLGELYSPAMLKGAKRVLGRVGNVTPKKQAQLNEVLFASVMTLTKQLSQVSREVKSLTSIEYRGVWQKGETYTPGDFVTHGGSCWHCNGIDVTARPGTGGEWTLAVKKGKDGR